MAMVMMFEGGVGSDVDRIPRLFLPKESYSAGVFVLLRIGAGAAEVSIEEGVEIISDNVADLTLGKSKTRVNGVRLIFKVDPLINDNLL